MPKNQQGFAHLLLILLVVGFFASSLVPINRHYNDGKSNVAGVSMIRSGNKGVGISANSLKISSDSGQTAVVDQSVGPLSSFPLSINPFTEELTVTTPAGSKKVAVLPQAAVANMLAAHVMDYVTGEKVNNSLASIPDLVKLEIKNDILGYKIEGVKIHKLLGLIPVKTKVEAFVSAENGQVVETKQSLLGRILNKLAL